MNDALARHGKPEIFNTDQGSQFSSVAFTGLLQEHKIAIRMDGRGAWRANVFVERLWRSVKYEEVYLRAYDCVSDARASLERYLDFYNTRRPHSSFGGADAGTRLSGPLAADAGSLRRSPVPRPHSGRATPSPRETAAPARGAYQPAGNAVIGSETL